VKERALGAAFQNELLSFVIATSFMTYHKAMNTSHDFIEGLRYARKLGDNITETIINWNSSSSNTHLTTNHSLTNLTNKVFPYR